MNDDILPKTKTDDVEAEIAKQESDFGDTGDDNESLDIDAAYEDLKGSEPSPDHGILGLDDEEDPGDTPPDLPPGFHEVEE